MGLSDRPYYRDEDRGAWLSPRPLVINLILLNVAVYVAQFIFGPQVSELLELHADLLQAPWQLYQLLTYGFVHAVDLRHILFNMFGLWVFGSELETLYGRAEFLRLYLSSIVVCGLVWLVYEISAGNLDGRMLGASGGVNALMIIFVLHFPRRMLNVWGILPVPVWLIGLLWVLFDLAGIGSTDNVAHLAHLAGVVYGAVYFKTGLNFGRFVPKRLNASMFRLRPRLKIHDPEVEERHLSGQVDQILEKIHREGEGSLTKKERRTLEEASRRYQRKRR